MHAGKHIARETPKTMGINHQLFQKDLDNSLKKLSV